MVSAQSWQQTLISLQADGTPLSNNNAATSILGSAGSVAAASKYVIPANSLTIGSVISVQARGRISNIVTTPGTLTLDVRFGSTVVWNGGAVQLNTTAKTNVSFEFETLLTVRAIGSGTASNLIGIGSLTSESLSGAAAGFANTALLPASAPAVGTGFDVTASQIVDLFGTFSIANSGNSITVHEYIIESLN